MNKRKLSIGLVSSVVGLLSISACSSGVKADDKNIVTFTGYDGETISVVTNSVYNEYRKETNGIAKFYDKILETVIRYQFDKNDSQPGSTPLYNKSLSTIKQEAKEQVESAKDEADENHKTNGTSYETEWQNILDKYNVEDEDELFETFVYQIEKTELTDLYFKENKANLVNEYIGVVKDGESGKAASETIKGVFPYHIKHILSKVSGGGNSYYNGQISSAEAIHLANTANALLSSSFADAAQIWSDDGEGSSSSKSKGGDLGIMSTTTSFVNEFKLGIYTFDNIYNTKTKTDAVTKGLGLDEEFDYLKDGVETNSSAYEYFSDSKIATVPFGAFKLLNAEKIYDGVNIGGYADIELDDNHKKVNDGNANYYPRNIFWNLYLNLHEVFVITNDALVPNANNVLEEKYVGSLSTTKDKGDTSKLSEFDIYGFKDTKFEKAENIFDYTLEENANKKVLTDGQGHIIVGVRSEHGIHFMVIQKSINDFKIAGGTDTKEVSLSEYYTTYVPGDDGYPYYTETGSGVKINKDTYVNFLKGDESLYNSRASEIKEAVKSFDANYDYRLFQRYENDGNFKFNNTDGLDLKAIIDEYINSSITNSRNSAYKSLKDSWKTYVELLEVEHANRTTVSATDENAGTTTSAFRLIPSRCAVGFAKHDDAAWGNGGFCVYEE